MTSDERSAAFDKYGTVLKKMALIPRGKIFQASLDYKGNPIYMEGEGYDDIVTKVLKKLIEIDRG